MITAGEVSACLRRQDSDASLAARFAAKEAAMKALGTGWGNGVGWRDLEVVGSAGQVPHLQLHGRAAHQVARAIVTINGARPRRREELDA